MQPTNPEKPPRNRDQEIPKRQGGTFASTATEARDRDRDRDRDRNAPVQDEETYEREPRN